MPSKNVYFLSFYLQRIHNYYTMNGPVRKHSCVIDYLCLQITFVNSKLLHRPGSVKNMNDIVH